MPEANENNEQTPSPELTALQQQINDLKEQVAESQNTARFWAERAKQPAPMTVSATPEPEDDTDVLEKITVDGVKGLDELAAKRGYIKRDEVRQIVQDERSSATKELELTTEYPDLKNKKSEFFQATAIHYGNLVRSGTPQPMAMELAARQTELQFLKEGKMKIPGEREKHEREQDRLDRIRAQSGENGRRPAPGADENDTELTAEQKHICDSMGIPYEAYAKRAAQGVAISGRR
jgi:hypothetical protein